MPSYPNSIFVPREKANRAEVEYDETKQTVIFVEDIKALEDEVVALETFLRIPLSQPESPVAGACWFEIGTSILHVFDGELWKAVQLV